MIPMKSADKAMAFVLIALGLAMLWGGYVMDRLEVRNIHPGSIPGLLPMVLGVLITLCGGLLYVTSAKDDPSGAIDFGNISNLLWAAALCGAFAILLVGKLPFYIATFVFITAFAARFTYDKAHSPRQRGQKLLAAVVMGLVFSGLISALFRYAFLVRLP
ncbi:MAG: tripartite tricarboxylate transporter TctB family protein [Rhodobacteraceae bacterium]|nr:tripartite tricarboxylate transporter TctB family protein [Paracoccaceae bacterium]